MPPADDHLDRAVAALTTPEVAHAVDVVLRRRDGGFQVAAARGRLDVRTPPSAPRALGDGETAEVTDLAGADPLADRAPTGEYPDALTQVARFFAAPHAPDLSVVFRVEHRHAGNVGEHGGLHRIHARAPFLAAGAGVRAEGTVDRGLRMVDVAPTLLALLGLTPDDDPRPPLRDGTADRRLLADPPADHVVAFLLDGCRADLVDAVIEAGRAPNLAALAARGTTYARGVLSSYPTATLANHTAALTGAHPGHSGVLHHAWLDRSPDPGTPSLPNLLDLPQLFAASTHIAPTVETVHESLHRRRPGSFSVCTFEFADRGADASTFADFRGGRPAPLELEDPPGADPSWLSEEFYRWMSAVDAASTAHACDLWAPTPDHPAPAFTWVNLSLTDDAGHHHGPTSDAARAALADNDRRIGTVMNAVADRGLLERTAVVVLADHGMAHTDPGPTVSVEDLLVAAGVDATVVDGQFVYLA